MVFLYSVTMGLSAFLLFLIQPMFAKMALPQLGGSAMVWNTAMVFFQVSLLLGYLYTHLSHRWLGVRRQSLLHCLIVLTPLAALPIALTEGWTPDVSNFAGLWLIGLMAASIGLPFLVIATLSPALQTWFAASGHRDAGDPYFLFAASNVASVVALLSYPTLIERQLSLAAQSWLWSGLYGLLIALVIGCAAAARRRPQSQHEPETAPGKAPAAVNSAVEVTWRRRLKWLGLAFAPSALMLAVTQHITTDLAPVPLLWVVPLAAYLLTYAIAFAKRPLLPHGLVRLLVVPALIAIAMLLHWRLPVFSLAIPLHLGTFFIIALYCHGELARTRPPAARLTGFYLVLSLGGALGGAFTALLAPVIFDRLLEYPLVLVLVALMRPSFIGKDAGSWRSDIAWLVIIALLVLWPFLFGVRFAFLPQILIVASMAAIAGGLAAASMRRYAFAGGIALVLWGSGLHLGGGGDLLFQERSYFGIYRVMKLTEGNVIALYHGVTLHGAQSTDPAKKRAPTTYYHRDSPVGQVFRAYGSETWPARAGLVGLGIGTLSCYAKPGQRWSYFEIDPLSVRIAKDNRYFSYLSDCLADSRIVLGDGRRSLERESDGSFDLLVMDAFSSDAVPMHLLTKEAIRLYLAKLKPDGIIAYHISNWNLDLRPVLAAAARDLDIAALVYSTETPKAVRNFERSSRWVVMSRRQERLKALQEHGEWRAMQVASERLAWSDDFSSLFDIINWKSRPIRSPWRY